MTTFTALRATDRISDPAAGLAAALLGCLEKLGRLDVGALDAAAKADLLTFYGRAEARLAALRLDLLAAAENAQVAKATGAATTVQWAANIANADHAEASRQVALAIGIQHRSGTRDALAAGVITPAHAAVIIRADQDLPPGVTREDRDRVEAALVRRAQDLSPAALRRAARRALAEIEPDPVVVDAHEDDLLRAEEQRARARTRLTFHDNGDGTVTGHFTVPVLHGHLLRKITRPSPPPGAAASAPPPPRQATPPGTAPGTAPNTPPGRGPTGTRPAAWPWSSSSSTSRPTTSTPRPQPPWSSRSARTPCAEPSKQPTSTPAPNSPPARPAAWSATPASNPPSYQAPCTKPSADPPSPWTSAAPHACSPKPNAPPSAWSAPPAPPKAATDPTPGPSSTTKTPGPTAAPPT